MAGGPSDGRQVDWRSTDGQMQRWTARLQADVGLQARDCDRLGTTIAAEARFLPAPLKDELAASSPVPLRHRLDELVAFQGWMDLARSSPPNPYVTRAQVLTQTYICFVYLPESCFRALAKHMPSGTVTKRCARFLSDNPVRSFRNAVAHSNWTYRDDFRALRYWARKGSDPTEPLSEFEVEQETLAFWQALSRCVAYASLSSLPP